MPLSTLEFDYSISLDIMESDLQYYQKPLREYQELLFESAVYQLEAFTESGRMLQLLAAVYEPVDPGLFQNATINISSIPTPTSFVFEEGPGFVASLSYTTPPTVAPTRGKSVCTNNSQ